MFDKPCKEIKEPNCFCEENKQALCIACSKEFKQDRDLQLCDDCITKYDTEKMWKDHDNNKIDILDVNENINLLNKYMK